MSNDDNDCAAPDPVPLLHSTAVSVNSSSVSCPVNDSTAAAAKTHVDITGYLQNDATPGSCLNASGLRSMGYLMGYSREDPLSPEAVLTHSPLSAQTTVFRGFLMIEGGKVWQPTLTTSCGLDAVAFAPLVEAVAVKEGDHEEPDSDERSESDPSSEMYTPGDANVMERSYSSCS